MGITIKRAYEPRSDDDGYRILVDRLWPRGLSKENAAIDLWAKDVAPSPDLRRWWNHDPDRMGEFEARYRVELDGNDAVDALRAGIREHSVTTLVYGAKDPRINHARVLLEYLAEG